MDTEIPITLPKLGESILHATIIKWFKKVGDPVELDEPLLEVATDKVNSEIPSPVSGILQSISAKEEQQVEVGDLLGTVSTKEEPTPARETTNDRSLSPSFSSTTKKKGSFSPAVLKIAQNHGIHLEELENIPSTGEGGRLSKKDLETYLKQKEKENDHSHKESEQIERMKLSPIRKMIADKLTRSFYEAPHATLVQEIDVTTILQLIDSEKKAFLEKYGYKLSITSFIAKGIARAVQKHPLLNASLEEDMIVLKRFVHLGIAVSIEQGILVPVIHNCHRLSVREIAKEVSHLAEAARRGELSPNQVGQGTITMTNFGMSGTLLGIPIIHYPEVAIIGVGAIQKRVAVLPNDQMAIRSMLHLSLTFDHRVIDGMYGCSFLSTLKKELETEAPSLQET